MESAAIVGAGSENGGYAKQLRRPPFHTASGIPRTSEALPAAVIFGHRLSLRLLIFEQNHSLALEFHEYELETRRRGAGDPSSCLFPALGVFKGSVGGLASHDRSCNAIDGPCPGQRRQRHSRLHPSTKWSNPNCRPEGPMQGE